MTRSEPEQSRAQRVHARVAPSDELADAVHAIATEPRLTAALQLAEQLRVIAMRTTDPAAAARLLADAVRDGDDVSALAAAHAIGAIPHPLADRVLLDLVLAGDEPFAGHAAWALGARGSSGEATDALLELVSRGGFTAMLAERTLLEWWRFDDAARLVRDAPARSFTHLATGAGDGIVVIQPFLHAHLDRSGSALGAGDAGGIASLLRSLGAALAHVDGVDEVITITRRHARGQRTGGSAADDVEPWSEQLAPGHRVERIDVGPAGPMPWRESWAYRTSIERDFLAIGRALSGRRVVWHLRMADVGTLAAAAAARRLGQPMVFTAAPDPHIVIDAMQEGGSLDRAHFAIEDAAQQFWFRARMVERLTAQADRVTLLPRPTITRELIELLGVDPAHLADRATVVPEGVDVVEIDRARARATSAGASACAESIRAAMPVDRRDLPWVLTVGRLHPSKGAHRLVEALVDDPTLASRMNLVIVGGDIDDPSPDEQSTIELIRRAAQRAAPGVVTLTGHLPPASIADLMVDTVTGGGLYACASDKEEFGLAIVEALAAGAVVVAPERGGPRTYVGDGLGVLCDSTSVTALRVALTEAMAMIDDPARARRARTMVRNRLSIEHMAERLGEVYRGLWRAAAAA